MKSANIAEQDVPGWITSIGSTIGPQNSQYASTLSAGHEVHAIGQNTENKISFPTGINVCDEHRNALLNCISE
jgi:hypothetical protein